MRSDDTIVAISSAVGGGSRTIVRLSGARAVEAAERLLPGWVAAPATAQRARMKLKRTEDLSFPVWVYCFVGPRSYSGEDLVELHLGGNALLARWVVEELLRGGCREAEAGEFTARAYFHGRIDLSEAEGVAATISAQNQDELAAARRLLSGELARRLRPIMDELAETLGLIELGIDFSEEDVTFVSPEQLGQGIAHVRDELSRLLDESARLERLSHEPHIVLVGRPNAGKSTLLNALAERERAVVSPVAGTTRDVLSAEVSLTRGIVRLIDAAGLDETPPSAQGASLEIAQQMRQRARRAVEEADVIVLVRDSGDVRPMLELPRAPDLLVASKSDLRDPAAWQTDGAMRVSAQTGQGLAELRQELDRLAFGGGHATWSLALNGRHVEAIEQARTILAGAVPRLDESADELIALDLREALDALGRILGTVSPDEVLGRIFSTFCIGK